MCYECQRTLTILKAQVTALELGGTYKGKWCCTTEYAQYDTVVLDGKPYLAVAASTAVKPGCNPSVWSLICY